MSYKKNGAAFCALRGESGHDHGKKSGSITEPGGGVGEERGGGGEEEGEERGGYGEEEGGRRRAQLVLITKTRQMRQH